MITFPIDPFLVGSDLTPMRERLHEFADGLTAWQPKTQQTGIHRPPMIGIEAAEYEAALDKMNNQFIANTWGDGLPLKAPTEARVDWILRGTDRPRHEVIGKIMPQGGITTIETLAISLGMAGGRPEYLPILIAALEAILDPGLEHDKWQATSGSTFPAVIVNGPIAQQIRLNAGFGLLGPDPQHPAGASIGRALRLLQQNVGGALPGTGTMAMFGAMRYTNAVFAEDEAGLPDGWEAVCTNHFGLPRGSNTVTVYVATGASNILRRGVGKETPEEEGLQSLLRVAGYLGSPNPHYTHGWAHGTPGALLMSRVVARQLTGLGWNKTTIKRFIWEHSHSSSDEIRDNGMLQWIQQAPEPATVASADMDRWPITRTPEQIILCVAGGYHPTHNFWMQACAPNIANRTITLPTAWETLIAEADAELGAGGNAGTI
ncbi:MAG: hypothetical protein O7G88_03095 [bacterium]|nr:hypothetical protein [bacterium]